MRKLYDRSNRRKDSHGHRSDAQSNLLALAKQALLAGVLASLLLACRSAPDPGPKDAETLKLATWNLEWLIAPRQFKQLRDYCSSAGSAQPRGARAIPCDVSGQLERSHADFAALREYARELDADVVALQETDGVAAARLVFPGAEFCFTGRSHPQNNGFAVRAGLPHRCEADFSAISAGDGLRRGAIMTLFPGEPRELTLMSVHLKSGCATAPLDSPPKPCRALAAQLPQLARWAAEQHRLGHRLVILGDFNRETLPALETFALADAGQGAAFKNCFPGQMHTGFIDHILLDPALLAKAIPGSFQHLTYRVLDVHRRKLSDHCPVGIRLKVDGSAFD